MNVNRRSGVPIKIVGDSIVGFLKTKVSVINTVMKMFEECRPLWAIRDYDGTLAV